MWTILTHEFFGSVHKGKGQLHAAIMDGYTSLQVSDDRAAILHPWAVTPEIAIKEHVARNRSAIYTDKEISAERVFRRARDEFPCSG